MDSQFDENAEFLDIICSHKRGGTFCFSSRPPQEIIDALRAIGVTVNWS